MTAHKLMIATPFDGGDLLTATVTLGYHRFVRYLERHMSADVLDGTALFACDVVGYHWEHNEDAFTLRWSDGLAACWLPQRCVDWVCE